MIKVHKSENKGITVGIWIFDENGSGVFIPTQSAKSVIEFIEKLSTISPGFEETYGCVNCALSITNKVLISDYTECVILKFEELTQFIENLQGIL